MTVTEIEDRAMMQEPLPTGIGTSDTWLYLCLRALHTEHRLGQITRDQGSHEKGMLLRAYEAMKFQETLGIHNGQMWKDIEAAASVFAKTQTVDSANGFYKAVYGVMPKKRGDVCEQATV